MLLHFGCVFVNFLEDFLVMNRLETFKVLFICTCASIVTSCVCVLITKTTNLVSELGASVGKINAVADVVTNLGKQAAGSGIMCNTGELIGNVNQVVKSVNEQNVVGNINKTLKNANGIIVDLKCEKEGVEYKTTAVIEMLRECLKSVNGCAEKCKDVADQGFWRFAFGTGSK